MKQFRKIQYQNYIIFFILLLIYLFVTLFLFHRQSVNYNGQYVSDIQPYIMEMQGISSGYDYPYPILFFLGRFFLLFTTPQHAMAFAVTLLSGLTVPALKFFFDKALCVSESQSFKAGLLSTLLTFSLVFVSMLYPLSYLGQYNPPGESYLYRYLGVFTPNPYHNATYLAARPFAIPVFFLFVDILGFYEKEEKWFHSKYLLMGVFLFLTTMTKPSFTLVFVATAGLIMLFRLIHSRFRGIRAFLKCGVWFIPTFCVLLYQFGDVFHIHDGAGTEKGIGFGFLTAWSQVYDNVPLAILRAIGFPLVVLLFCAIHKVFPAFLKLAWQLFLVSLATLIFLYEKGYRLPHVNFSWGYMYGIFFLYVTSLILLAQCSLHRRQPIWQLAIQWGIYGLHLICGLDYFRVLLQGGLFH
ncbi:MAG: hypothetical protein HDQ96_09400 [Lachnospiraceae bacterium]|nr:hypothetical protein [Lachnospiraceae bacterium]